MALEVIKGSREDIPEELKPKDKERGKIEVSKDPPLEGNKKIGDQGDEAIDEYDESDEEIGNEEAIEKEKKEDKTSIKNEEGDKKIKERDAQKAHWRNKALKLEKQLKSKLPSEEEESEEFWKAKVDFLLTHKDYNGEEFDHIASVALSKGISLSEAAEKESDYINFRRKKAEEKKKIPAPSSSSSFEKKEFKDIAKMSKSEHKKLDEEFQRKQMSRGAGV